MGFHSAWLRFVMAHAEDPWSPKLVAAQRAGAFPPQPARTGGGGSGGMQQLGDGQSVLARARQEGVSAAVAFRSAPPGRAAAFNAILEVRVSMRQRCNHDEPLPLCLTSFVRAAHALLQLTRGGDLVVSFVQHMAVRRRVKNPFEDADVVGITNYIDLGLRLAAPLARERALAVGGSAFELAAAWQVNKNWLAKLKVGSHVTEGCLAFKSWWLPAVTGALCASRRAGEASTRYGVTLALDNVGVPRFERADPGAGGAQAAAARRYLAVQDERDAAAGVRPLMNTTGLPPSDAQPAAQQQQRKAAASAFTRRAVVAGGVADSGATADGDAFASRL